MSDSLELIELMRELVQWTKVGFHRSVKEVLMEALPTEKSKLIYQSADGSRTVDDLRKLASTSPNTVMTLFKKCEALGLLGTSPKGQRYRLFDLEDFGLRPAEKEETKNG